MKPLLILGVVALAHVVYSTIEFHKFSKDLVHPLSLPKDLIVAAVVSLWAAAPSKDKLMKIKADEFFQDVKYDEGTTNKGFRNFYASRAKLIMKRATEGLPKPPE